MVDMNDLINFVVLVALAALIAGSGALALDAFNDDLTADSEADNVTDNGLAGLLNVTDQLPTIGTIVGVAVLIGIVIAAFRFARN
jgi:TRAP-type C4-dicarboxylate transport system permease small subunit